MLTLKVSISGKERPIPSLVSLAKRQRLGGAKIIQPRNRKKDLGRCFSQRMMLRQKQMGRNGPGEYLGWQFSDFIVRDQNSLLNGVTGGKCFLVSLWSLINLQPASLQPYMHTD